MALPTGGIAGRQFAHGAVALFSLARGLRLAPWAPADLAQDRGLPISPASPPAFSPAQNVGSRREADAVMAKAAAARAIDVKRAADTFVRGYARYFRDPDRHPCEVAWSPEMLPG